MRLSRADALHCCCMGMAAVRSGIDINRRIAAHSLSVNFASALIIPLGSSYRIATISYCMSMGSGICNGCFVGMLRYLIDRLCCTFKNVYGNVWRHIFVRYVSTCILYCYGVCMISSSVSVDIRNTAFTVFIASSYFPIAVTACRI